MKRRQTRSFTPVRILTFAVALIGALAMMGPHLSRPVSAQSKATATNVPVIPHEAVPNFFKNPPGIYTGENMGISTNSKGQIYIYHRAYETRLFEYSSQRPSSESARRSPRKRPLRTSRSIRTPTC